MTIVWGWERSLIIIIGDQGVYGVLAQEFSSFEASQFDEEGNSHDVSVKFFHQLTTGIQRATCGQEIVNDQDMLSWFYGVGMNFQKICAVFQHVFLGNGFGRKFFVFSDGDKSAIKFNRDGGAEDEASTFCAYDELDVFIAIGFGHFGDGPFQAFGME